MILEKFTKSNSIFLNLSFNFEKKFINILLSFEWLSLTEIRLLLSSRLFTELITFEWICIIDELKVFNVVLFVTIGFDEGLQFFLCHCKAQVGKDLSELFGADLEMLVPVEILEETLGV